MLQHIELKQRIVGGIVLISLGVIVIPFLMDDPHQEVQILESNIPAWPEDPPLNVIDISEKEFTSVPNPVKAAQPQVPAPSKQVKAEPRPPQPQQKSTVRILESSSSAVKKQSATATGKRWEVQVASYSVKNRKHAQNFLKKMQKKGYKVELKEVTQSGKKRLRLSTLPLSSSKSAKEMKKKIDREFKVDKVNSMIRLLK